ncbi:MAG: bifunctional folylpolyglutamate synthase/dihydrofolate synthase [Agromyces sp.]
MTERVYQELLTRVGEQNPRPRLEPTRRLVNLLGNPERSAPVIHLTGTNGKTSTARVIDSLVRASGLRTGLLTSPHLERFAERILIDGEPIDDDALERNWDDIEPFVHIVDEELTAAGELPLTFFEVLTALAFAAFADAPVDVIILEVGMGGEWDSTNVADATVAVFTPIDLDHLGRIGNSLEEIAHTKAGIIKPGSFVVSAAQPAAVERILRERAEQVGATFRLLPNDAEVTDLHLAVGGQLLSIRGLARAFQDLFLPLFGAHQAENAALALVAVEAFLGGGSVPLADELVIQGFAGASSPGRLELIGSQPAVLVDGAHNPHGMRSLVRAVKTSFNFDELVVVVGVLADKDVDGVLQELAELHSPVIVTESRSERALPTAELRTRAEAAGLTVSSIPDAEIALESAREWARGAPGRGVLVTGSLTLVGLARGIASTQGWSVV